MPNIRRVIIALLVVLAMTIAPRAAVAQVSVGISVRLGPPPLPVYVQPPCPGPRFIWVPGYWAWGSYGYYWVPGTWVLAPRPGLLWTPGYWGWRAGFYVWHPGYWGRHVGFYGGINYGFGYTGFSYLGGYWRHGEFFYNRSVNNVNDNVVRNTYYRRVVHKVKVNRVSYNGGRGGVAVRPTRTQKEYARERHFRATQAQIRHQRVAGGMRAMRASFNHGRPAIAATGRPGVFRGHGAVPAVRAGGPYHRPRGSTHRQRKFSRPPQNSSRRQQPQYHHVRPNQRQNRRPYREQRSQRRSHGDYGHGQGRKP